MVCAPTVARYVSRKTFATMDHNVSTQTKDINACGEMARIQMQELIKNCKEFGVELYDLNHPYQGIVHVMGPEQGVTLPGMTIVCGDSHTATHARLAHWPLVSALPKLNTYWQRNPEQAAQKP